MYASSRVVSAAEGLASPIREARAFLALEDVGRLTSFVSLV